MSNPGSVLIIKPGSLGDIVHALPTVGYLRATWPGAKISWIVDRRWRNLLDGVAGIDEKIDFPREDFRGAGGWASSVAWFRGLAGLRPDLAIDLQGLMRSALMAKASGAMMVIGGDDAREGAAWLYHIQAKINPSDHAVNRYRTVLKAAGIETGQPPKFPLGPGLEPPEKPPKDFVLLNPFSRGEGKSLSLHQVDSLIRALDPMPILVAGHGEISLPGVPDNGYNWLNKTRLQEFVWLTHRARLVVSVDSGPAHIAAAVNPNLLVIHTWSDPRQVGPYSEAAYIWQGGKITQQSLSLTSPLSPSRAFQDDDVPAVAEWVRSFSDRVASPA